ncbi:Uu.00g087000.m01.CDS01 [Anthostomella pinea]|uniref:Uu.00g087000.m01.CDS01 n=1 Tax=Anthostomella pinea TaxID=933095 RepID=A0AAI8YHJ4_9PEZI|nr:Uu.00g087000.m01.CDS01 [Anthostomella pinea]
MPDWTRLPPEIRLMVLEELVRAEQKDDHKVSGYAVVSREWQVFFERHTFKKLKLHQGHLAELKRILHNTYRLPITVEDLWFNIQLPRFGCESCQTEESAFEEWQNNVIFTKAIWKLFKILGSWSRRRPLTDGKRMTLSLSAR